MDTLIVTITVLIACFGGLITYLVLATKSIDYHMFAEENKDQHAGWSDDTYADNLIQIESKIVSGLFSDVQNCLRKQTSHLCSCAKFTAYVYDTDHKFVTFKIFLDIPSRYDIDNGYYSTNVSIPVNSCSVDVGTLVSSGLNRIFEKSQVENHFKNTKCICCGNDSLGE